jgi:AcrR family transcriptional regulator
MAPPEPSAEPTDGVIALPSVPALARGLPPPPPASLDPFLDAAAGCFARYGIARTSVQDIAQALRVNRTTVYRQVGNIESIVRLLAARDLHRLLAGLAPAARAPLTPTAVVDLLVGAVAEVRAHPVVAKVLADERELIGALLDDLPDAMGRMAIAIVPLLASAMASGHLARRDPVVVAEWLMRVGITAVLAPPPGELHTFLAELLHPALDPQRSDT